MLLRGAHAPSRAGLGALAQTIFRPVKHVSSVGADPLAKVRGGEGAAASTRGRVRSPDFARRGGGQRRVAVFEGVTVPGSTGRWPVMFNGSPNMR